VREMGDGRRKWEKKKIKCANHVREKGETKLLRELVSEYYSSKLVSIFTHQNFLVKVVRLLGGFLVFSSNWLTKKLFW
jgi:hypothetical protein